MSRVAGRIADAVGTGEVVDIVYDGGSQPGTRREIVVLAFDGLHVSARCMATNETRTFRVDRMRLPEEVPGAPLYKRGSSGYGATFRQAIDVALGRMATGGYVVVRESTRVRLHRLGGNGKPIRRVEVEIAERGTLRRSWRVSGPTRNKLSYARLDRAVAAFLEEGAAAGIPVSGMPTVDDGPRQVQSAPVQRLPLPQPAPGLAARLWRWLSG